MNKTCLDSSVLHECGIFVTRPHDRGGIGKIIYWYFQRFLSSKFITSSEPHGTHSLLKSLSAFPQVTVLLAAGQPSIECTRSGTNSLFRSGTNHK